MLLHVDARQAALLQAVPHCNRLADIGTDHGKLPALLLMKGVCKQAVLADISALSLQKARDLFHDLRLEGEFVVSDGLSSIDGALDCIVIAGMGSATICHILESGREKLGGAVLVLGPNLKEEETRAFLQIIGYALLYEYIVEANQKLYCILVAAPGARKLSDRECFIGKIHEKNTVQSICKYLRKKEKALRIRLAGLQQSSQTEEQEMSVQKQRLEWVLEELKVLCL